MAQDNPKKTPRKRFQARKRQPPQGPDAKHAAWLPPGAIGRPTPKEVPLAIREAEGQLLLPLNDPAP
jgi:hypothetical protein